MAKQGKSRTMSICLSDIPTERMTKHKNGKIYLAVQTWDNDAPDKYDNDFSVSISPTKEEIAAKKAGAKIDRVFIGNGIIWEDKGMRPATAADTEDLGY